MSVRNPFAMWGAVCIIFSSSLDCRLTSSPYIPCRNTGGGDVSAFVFAPILFETPRNTVENGWERGLNPQTMRRNASGQVELVLLLERGVNLLPCVLPPNKI